MPGEGCATFDHAGRIGPGSPEIHLLRENIRGELSDVRKYTEQARRTSSPTLHRLWLRLAQEERRHALEQARLLRSVAPEVLREFSEMGGAMQVPE